MANHTLNVYLGEELSARVDKAKLAGRIDPKEVVKTALLEALGDAVTSATISELGLVTRFQAAWTEVVNLLGVDPKLTDQDSVSAVLQAIEKLQHPPIIVDADSSERTGSGEVDMRTEFDTYWAASTSEMSARLAIVAEQGGFVQSVVPDGDQFLILVAKTVGVSV